MRGEVATFLLAVQFLTRLPLPREVGYTPARMAASVRYYPLVGLLLGLVLAASLLLATASWGPLLGVLTTLALGGLLTGAFHEDGLADTFDGLGGLDRDAALRIMRDSRVGTYGVFALLAVLALKAAALVSIGEAAGVGGAASALVAGQSASRLSAVLVIATGRYARDEGTGKPVSDGIGGPGMVVATATGTSGLVVVALGVSAWPALGALLGLALGHVFVRLLTERRLRGYTGDTLGAVQQLSELGLYLGVAACL